MRFRFQPWQLAILVIAACAGVIAFARWRSLAKPYDAAQLLSALPVDRGTLFFVDVDQLRQGGILDALAGSKAVEEPDYRNFVDQTGFDYRSDLNSVAAVFDSGKIYAAIRGRFDWKQLAAYARSQGGVCQYTICTMPASAPDRNISFYPIRRDVLALAVTSEERGVATISPGQGKPKVIPEDPIWLWAPRQSFQRPDSLPAGVQLLLAPLTNAQSIALSAGPGKNGLRLHAVVALASPNDAVAVAKQFQTLTNSLRQLAPADAGSGDLMGLLANGSIEPKGASVIAEWPIAPEFLKSLATDRQP
ncbi:MAG: hypothetical protein ABL995_12455 [Bryobacteraceae bacterium]